MSEFNKMMNKKAVALQYDEQKQLSPVIVASGCGYMAEKIIEVANENHVPVYEDNSLASVLSRLDLGSNIPIELYEAVVDIYVFFLKYSPKAKAEFQKMEQQSTKDSIDINNTSSENEITSQVIKNDKEDKAEKINSIEYETRQLLKELELSDETTNNDNDKAIPWLPEEF